MQLRVELPDSDVVEHASGVSQSSTESGSAGLLPATVYDAKAQQWKDACNAQKQPNTPTVGFEFKVVKLVGILK